MSNRTDELAGGLLRHIHQEIASSDLSYDEFAALKKWLIDVGEAGEWPLFLDVFIESAVEQNAYKGREGSKGTILGPYYLPDAPVLSAPFELPRREDESGQLVVMEGHVADASGAPLAGAVLDVWQADADGLYSGFDPRLPEGILRGKVVADERGHFELRTIMPAPYTIPMAGPTGALCRAANWSPWRPAHIHLIITAEGHEELVTQLFFDQGEHLDNDVAGAVKEDLVVRPTVGEHAPQLSFSYDFTLASIRATTPDTAGAIA
jgi:catechol 1,2-dioxygenase